MSSDGIVLHRFGGEDIGQRADGYIDGTALCRANGKLIGHYLANQATREFLDEVSETIGIPIVELIETREGRSGGTWVHPLIAYNLGQWCSAKAAVFVAKLLHAINTGELSVMRTRDLSYLRAELDAAVERHIPAIAETVTNRVMLAVEGIVSTARRAAVDEALHGAGILLAPGTACLIDIKERVRDNRKRVTIAVVREHCHVVFEYYGRKCPMCRKVYIVDERGRKLINARIDHWWRPSASGSDCTWLICTTCHNVLYADRKRDTYQSAFNDFQRLLGERSAQLSLPWRTE